MAVRRQTLVALAAVFGVVALNLYNGGVDGEVVGACAGLAVLCMAPSVFAWSKSSYRVAVIVLAALLSVAAIRAILVGGAALLPASAIAWLALMPAKNPARTRQ